MRLRVLFVVCVTVLLAMGGVATARPGGGGSYHGGGSTGGSTGGGHSGFSGTGVTTTGGGGGSLGPLGSLVLLGIIGVVVVLVLVQRSRQRNAPRAEQYDAGAAQRASVSLGALQARDPALTEQSIVDHVRPMSEQLRNAWCGGNMLPGARLRERRRVQPLPGAARADAPGEPAQRDERRAACSSSPSRRWRTRRRSTSSTCG